jgi:hypothetical protein
VQDLLFQTHCLSNSRIYHLGDIRDFPLEARNINVHGRKVLLTPLYELVDDVGNVFVRTSIIIATEARQPDIDSFRYRLVRINSICQEQRQVQTRRIGRG